MQLAGDNGIGRVDIVESRFVGMKSRGVYETPGGTVLMIARRAMESICLDRGELHLKVQIFLSVVYLMHGITTRCFSAVIMHRAGHPWWPENAVCTRGLPSVSAVSHLVEIHMCRC